MPKIDLLQCAGAVALFALCLDLAAETVSYPCKSFSVSGSWGTRSDGSCAIAGDAKSGKVMSGTMSRTFDAASGTFAVKWSVKYEGDGTPSYKITIAGIVVKEGKFPDPGGCDVTREATIDFGKVTIAKGAKIEVWGQSDYATDCRTGGEYHGAYCRWTSMNFERAGSTAIAPDIARAGSKATFSDKNSTVLDIVGRRIVNAQTRQCGIRIVLTRNNGMIILAPVARAEYTRNDSR